MTVVERRRVKRRVLMGTLADFVVDMLIPTVVYALLRLFGVPPFLAIAAGGLVVGGKAQVGSVSARHPRGAVAAAAAQVGAGLVIMFALHAAGVSDPYAMTIGSVPVLVGVVVALVRGGRLDGFGLLVIAEVAAGTALGMTSGDPRFLLARSSVYVAIAGVYALVTCFTPRPLLMVLSKPMAVAGDPLREAAFDRLADGTAEGAARFRRIEVAMTAGAGVVLLAEAVLRVVVVYAYPIHDVLQAGLMSQLPAIGLLVVGVAAMRVFAIPRVRVVVDAEQERLRAAV
ncbi:MAG TPA: VC0807 family protein [Streptosporangiaceae bacterium]|jgi:hypothetical protein